MNSTNVISFVAGVGVFPQLPIRQKAAELSDSTLQANAFNNFIGSVRWSASGGVVLRKGSL